MLDLGQVLSNAVAQIRAEWLRLSILAGLLVLFPAALLFTAMFDLVGMLVVGMSAPEPSVDYVAAASGRIMLFGVLTMFAQLLAHGAMIALLGEDQPGLAASFKRAMKYFPTIVAAAVIFYVAMMLAMFTVMAVIAGIGTALEISASEGAAAVVIMVGMLPLLLTIPYVMLRLSLTLPVAILERRANPFTALLRSWRLTKSNVLRVLGLYIINWAAYSVVSTIALALLAIVYVTLGGGTLSAILMGSTYAFSAAIGTIIFSAILSSMHSQLNGAGSPSLSATFE